MRMPEIARAITSCWISLVPSKIVWIFASRCQRSTGYSRVSPELLADHAREQHRVAVVPGSPRWFGEGAAGHVRVCFATSDSILATGLDRLDRAIRSF